MFDMGFINDVRFMLRRLPPPDKRLSMLFSATMAQKVMELAYEHMNNAKLIKIESDSPAVERIVQTMYHPANDEKIPLLLGLIKKFQPVRSIIFVNTKHAAIRVWEYLMSNGHPSALISGDIQQSKRESLLKKFHDGEYSFLVATDVASRGLHIPDVTHVFNYDLPDLGEDYVHRIGRTARVGNKGHAISFACEDFAMNLMDIESYIEKSVPNESITSELLIKPTPRKRLMKQKPRGKPQGGRGRPHHSQGQQRNNNNNRNSNSQRRRRPPNKSNQSTQKSD
jgi:ATP-dependent RNA helicase RhlB